MRTSELADKAGVTRPYLSNLLKEMGGQIRRPERGRVAPA